jgi:hypothetical protein
MPRMRGRIRERVGRPTGLREVQEEVRVAERLTAAIFLTWRSSEKRGNKNYMVWGRSMLDNDKKATGVVIGDTYRSIRAEAEQGSASCSRSCVISETAQSECDSAIVLA